MKNNTEKLEETKLTISLRTGLMHSNKQEEAHTQNDYSSYYIGAINYFIRVALEAESLLEQQTESKAFVNDAQFRENMQFLVQISEALAEWLPDYSHAMHDKVFGMNEADSPIDAPAPEAQTQTEQPKAKTLAEHHLQIMANKISHILRSDKVSDDAKDAFHSIIVDASNEARTNVGASNPEVIKIAFPLIIESLECDYGRGVVHSLTSLLDSSLVHSIEDELRQYEKRFDGRASEFDGSPSEPDVLGLSDSSIEDLAQKLSDIMHNPNLPEVIQDCLEDNLNVNHIDFYSPENILGNLKQLSNEKSES